jgi:plastocyanin
MTESGNDIVEQVVVEENEPALRDTGVVDLVDDSAYAGPPPTPSAFEQYALPLFLPLLIVGGVIFYVINLSRVFLASSDTVSVVIATVVTVAILGGATLLSAAPRVRSSSIMLVALGFFALILMAGTLTIGASQPHSETATFPPGTPSQDLALTGTTNLKFIPNQATLKTGFVEVDFTSQGHHTFTPQDQRNSVLEGGIPEIVADSETVKDRMFIGEPGEYVFYCSVPGHRAAGMEMTVTVTGDPTTVEQAAADLKP